MAGWLPPGKQTFVDDDGHPLAGGLLHHYIPGTDTRKTTWQDYDQTAANTNPIELDERGQAIIYGNGRYRQVLQDADGVEIWDRNVSAGSGSNSLSSGTIFGLTIGNNVASPTTQIDISVGQARDSTNTVDIVLSTPLTKSLTVVWGAGSVQGMRDSAAALATLQSYAIYLIMNPDTDAVDVLASQSATNPTLPDGYTYFRRIAFLPRLGTNNIPASGTGIQRFYQWGDIFRLYNGNSEWQAQTGSTAALLRDMYLPLGAKVEGMFYGQLQGDSGIMRVWDPDQGIVPALGGTGQWGQIRMHEVGDYDVADFNMTCNTSGQVYVEVSNVAAIWALKTIGWVDPRGLFG